MKFENLSKATDLLRARARVEEEIDAATHKLGITFGGHYQEDAILDLARPAILAHLKAQRDAVDESLRALGVEF